MFRRYSKIGEIYDSNLRRTLLLIDLGSEEGKILLKAFPSCFSDSAEIEPIPVSAIIEAKKNEFFESRGNVAPASILYDGGNIPNELLIGYNYPLKKIKYKDSITHQLLPDDFDISVKTGDMVEVEGVNLFVVGNWNTDCGEIFFVPDEMIIHDCEIDEPFRSSMEPLVCC